METQQTTIGQQIRNILGVAGGQESIKVDVSMDAQTGIALGFTIFAAVLLAVIVGGIVAKKA